MTTLELDVFQTIEAEVSKVTEAALLQEGSKLPPVAKNEKTIGTIHNILCRKMWVAANRLHHFADIDDASANLTETEEEAEQLRSEARRKHALEKVLRGLFIYQSGCEMGYFNDSEGNWAIRQDWMVISSEEDPRPDIAQVLRRLL